MRIDGTGITPGSEGCKCDSLEPRPDGRERDCEMPCWQRLGMDIPACCPDCPPLTPMCACGHEECYHEDGRCHGGYPDGCSCESFSTPVAEPCAERPAEGALTGPRGDAEERPRSLPSNAQTPVNPGTREEGE